MLYGTLTSAARTLSRRGPTAALRSLSTSAPLRNSTEPQAEATAGEQKIREILTAKFQPSVLKVQDVSGKSLPPSLSLHRDRAKQKDSSVLLTLL